MKKLIAMMLVLVMALSMVACNGSAPETTTAAPETTAPTTEAAPVAGSALEILETTWGQFGEDEKFFAMGGDFNAPVDGAPGAVDVSTMDFLGGTLLVPEAQAANVTEAASLMHAMMANNFTCGAFRVTGDAAAFATAMHDAIANNPWICGMPEKMIIAVVDGNYVVAGFGINDAVTPFETAFTATYPDAEMKYNEAITG